MRAPLVKVDCYSRAKKTHIHVFYVYNIYASVYLKNNLSLSKLFKFRSFSSFTLYPVIPYDIV